MKALKWLDEHFEECIMVLALWVATFVSTLQIVMRFVVNHSLSWPEELCRYVFIWFSYIALSYAVRYDCHIRIDLFEILIPKLKKPFGVICDIGFTVFCIYMIRPGWRVVSQLMSSGQVSAAMQLPMYVVYFSLYVGVILSIVRVVQKYALKIINRGKTPPEPARTEEGAI